jgi:hypothetical protein
VDEDGLRCPLGDITCHLGLLLVLVASFVVADHRSWFAQLLLPYPSSCSHSGDSEQAIGAAPSEGGVAIPPRGGVGDEGGRDRGLREGDQDATHGTRHQAGSGRGL